MAHIWVHVRQAWNRCPYLIKSFQPMHELHTSTKRTIGVEKEEGKDEL